MSEERAEYTVHPDVAIRLETSEKYIKHLTSTIDGMTMVMGRHADTITAQRERIAELEATVARLEADNRRLRHLDAMPVDAMRLYDEAHATCRWIILHAAMDDYPRMQRVLSIAMRRRERRERALYRAILTGGGTHD